jgi:hypothetical protein
MSISFRGRVRVLTPSETQEAHRVFGNALRYDRVRVHEDATWTNALDRIGRRLKGTTEQAPPPNAVTLGYHCFFPQRLSETFDLWDMAWLIHELTHVRQFEQMGWSYLARALWAQLAQKKKAYDIPMPEDLRSRRGQGWRMSRFNLEQQGNLVSRCYRCLHVGDDESANAYLPFVRDITDSA